MNSKWQKTINILTLAVLVICLIKIGWLQGDIRNLQNTVNNHRSMLQSSIDSISSRIRYEMEQENNLLSDSRWNTIGLDVKNKTATLYCYVVPKVYNPEKTVAAIVYNNNKLPMTLESGRYIAEIDIPLFEDCQIDNVQFEEDGTIRTQKLNWVINPRYEEPYEAFVGHEDELFNAENFDDRFYEINSYLELLMEGYAQYLCKSYESEQVKLDDKIQRASGKSAVLSDKDTYSIHHDIFEK